MGRFKCASLCLTILVLFALAKSQRAGVNICRNIQMIPCDNSQCILRDGWCDKIPNCADGTDEKYCAKHGIVWTANNYCNDRMHFTCENARCIPAVALCDSFDDCGDFSDEDESYCNQTNPDSPIDPTAGDLSLDAHQRYSAFTTAYTIISSTDATTDYYGRKTKLESVDPQRNIHGPNTGDDYSPSPHRSNVNGPVDNQNQGSPQQRNIQTPSYSYPINPTSGSVPIQQHTRRPHRYENNNYDSRQNPQHYNYNRHGGDSNRQSTRNNNNRQGTRYNNNRQREGHHEYGNNNNQNPASRPRTPNPQSIPDYNRQGYIPAPEIQPPSRSDPRGLPVHRQQPQIYHPRAVIYPPPQRLPYYSEREANSLSLPRFYFAKDYANLYGSRYKRNITAAKQWLLGQRDIHYSWKANTSRVLVALSLMENSFTTDVVDNELMMKGLQNHLGIRLLRNRTEIIPTARLAMYINALLATCQNPRDFMTLDLVEILLQRVYFERVTEKNPFVDLTLCLAGVTVNGNIIRYLRDFVKDKIINQKSKEQHILATSALACFLQDTPQDDDLRRIVHEAIEQLIREKYNDGSFGDIYSTALAAQAFMSVNTTSYLNLGQTLDYIAAQQQPDGSFGDMLSTYYSVPALSGRSLLHIRNTRCTERAASGTSFRLPILNPDGPMKSFFVTVKIGYPERTSYSMQLTVRDYANLFDSLQAAEHFDRRYKFESEHFQGTSQVHTISKIPNDPEQGLYWNLYVLKPSDMEVDLRQRSTADIRRIIPKDNEEILFWYLPSI